jgi:hypothetical protein
MPSWDARQDNVRLPLADGAFHKVVSRLDARMPPDSPRADFKKTAMITVET